MIEPKLSNGKKFSGKAIGLLGGSFNPAHAGHLEISLYALKKLKLDQIWWLVSPQNPLKPEKGMEDFDKRIVAAKKCVGRRSKIVVSPLEAKMKTKYTVDTLRKLKRLYPKTFFVWLMGADNLKQISKWRNWEDIFNLVPIAVFRRPAHLDGAETCRAAKRFKKFRIPPSQAAKMAQTSSKDLPLWAFLDNKLNYSSSTKIRKRTPSCPKRRKK